MEQAIIFLLCSFFLSSFFIPCLKSQRLHIGCLPYFYTWCGRCEFRMQVWNVLLLAGNAGPKKSPKIRHLGTIAQLGLYLRNLGTYWQSEKNLLNSNISPTCAYNMKNFGPLAAEIVSLVWGTPDKFERVSHFGTVTARHSSSGRQPNFAALSRGRHLYSEGRPSRWALAHILVSLLNRFFEFWPMYPILMYYFELVRTWPRETSAQATTLATSLTKNHRQALSAYAAHPHPGNIRQTAYLQTQAEVDCQELRPNSERVVSARLLLWCSRLKKSPSDLHDITDSNKFKKRLKGTFRTHYSTTKIRSVVTDKVAWSVCQSV